MHELDSIKQYNFPWPNEDKGYELFPSELESDPLIAFHGTAELNLDPIVMQGFKIQGRLKYISFAKRSSFPLGHACGKRSHESPKGVVIAVRFNSLNPPCVVEETSCIYLYCQDQQPEIIGYCVVPAEYANR